MNAVSGAAKAAADAVREMVGDTVALQSFRILRFGRHSEGYFHAEVAVNGDKAYVHCQWGSWLLPLEIGSRSCREVLSPYRDALAEKAREFEGRERRAHHRKREETMATANDAATAVRLLKGVGYDNDEIVDAVMQRFQMTRAKVCGILRQIDPTTTTTEED